MITILPSKTPIETRLEQIDEQLKYVENYAKGAAHALNKLSDSGFLPVGGVYILTNLINSKLYVGETLNIRTRMNHHKNFKHNQIICNAVKKYGADNFLCKVIYLPNRPKSDLLDIEELLIRELSSLVPSGYNVCTRGNDCSGFKRSEETKQKMRKPKSEEHKKKLSLAKMGIPSPLKGISISEETKKKISKANSGKIRSDKVKMDMSIRRTGKPSGSSGKKWTEESKHRASEAQLKRHKENPTRCINKSGFKGVSKRGNNYSARITIDSKRIRIGSFKTKEEAYNAIKNYDKNNTGQDNNRT